MRPALLITALLILLATSSNAYSQAPAWTIQSENDAYADWGDEDYTNGLRISLDFSRAVLWGRLFPSLQDCSTAPRVSSAPCRKTTLFVGQNFYTPLDITVPEFSPPSAPTRPGYTLALRRALFSQNVFAPWRSSLERPEERVCERDSDLVASEGLQVRAKAPGLA
jgi:hypothetical protein